MLGTSRFGHVGQADKDTRFVSTADIAFIPDTKFSRTGIEGESTAHVDGTSRTQNFTERSNKDIAGSQFDHHIGRLQFGTVLTR